MKEFNWLGYCVSCNAACCHNEDKSIPENECIRPEVESGIERISSDTYKGLQQDYRPLECRLFPFDIKEIDEKLTWVMWNNCHATPKLDYEKFIGYFEGHFSRTIPLDKIRQYVVQQKLSGLEKFSTEKFVVIREVNWPTE
jgi:hypothetical protein